MNDPPITSPAEAENELEDRKGGFPHSEICGSKGARTSPQLIAACHVLHSLPAPRHPSEALTRLIVLSKTHARGGSRRDLRHDRFIFHAWASYLPDYICLLRVRPVSQTFTAGRTPSFTMSTRPGGPGRETCFPNAIASTRLSETDGGARRDRTDDLMLAKHALYQLSYGPYRAGFRSALSSVVQRVVGPGRFELPTSRLSGVRSNQLSYGPSGAARARCANSP